MDSKGRDRGHLRSAGAAEINRCGRTCASCSERDALDGVGSGQDPVAYFAPAAQVSYETPPLPHQRCGAARSIVEPGKALSPRPGHRGHERSVRRHDARVRHVQRVWRRRPRLDAHSFVFQVIDDPILAVGTDNKLQFARPAHDGVGAQVTEAVIPRPRRGRGQFATRKASRVRSPTSAPAQRQVQARRPSPSRRGDGQTRDASQLRLAWPRAHAIRYGTSLAAH